MPSTRRRDDEDDVNDNSSNGHLNSRNSSRRSTNLEDEQQPQLQEDEDQTEMHDIIVTVKVGSGTRFTVTPKGTNGLNICIDRSHSRSTDEGNANAAADFVTPLATLNHSSAANGSGRASRRTSSVTATSFQGYSFGRSRRPTGNTDTNSAVDVAVATTNTTNGSVNSSPTRSSRSGKTFVDCANFEGNDEFRQMLEHYAPQFTGKTRATILDTFMERFTVQTHLHGLWCNVCDEDARRMVVRTLSAARRSLPAAKTASTVTETNACNADVALTVPSKQPPAAAATTAAVLKLPPKPVVRYGHGGSRQHEPGNAAYIRDIGQLRPKYQALAGGNAADQQHDMIVALQECYHFEKSSLDVSDEEHKQAVYKRIQYALSKTKTDNTSSSTGRSNVASKERNKSTSKSKKAWSDRSSGESDDEEDDDEKEEGFDATNRTERTAPVTKVATSATKANRQTQKPLVRFGMGAVHAKEPGNAAYLHEISLLRPSFAASSQAQRRYMIQSVAKRFDFEMPSSMDDKDHALAVHKKIHQALSGPSRAAAETGRRHDSTVSPSKGAAAAAANNHSSDESGDEEEEDSLHDSIVAPRKKASVSKKAAPAAVEANKAKTVAKLRVCAGKNPGHRTLPGNVAYRQLVRSHRAAFVTADPTEREAIVEGIAEQLDFEMPDDNDASETYESYVYRKIQKALSKPSQQTGKRQRGATADSDAVVTKKPRHKRLGITTTDDEDAPVDAMKEDQEMSLGLEKASASANPDTVGKTFISLPGKGAAADAMSDNEQVPPDDVAKKSDSSDDKLDDDDGLLPFPSPMATHDTVLASDTADADEMDEDDGKMFSAGAKPAGDNGNATGATLSRPRRPKDTPDAPSATAADVDTPVQAMTHDNENMSSDEMATPQAGSSNHHGTLKDASLPSPRLPDKTQDTTADTTAEAMDVEDEKVSSCKAVQQAGSSQDPVDLLSDEEEEQQSDNEREAERMDAAAGAPAIGQGGDERCRNNMDTLASVPARPETLVPVHPVVGRTATLGDALSDESIDATAVATTTSTTASLALAESASTHEVTTADDNHFPMPPQDDAVETEEGTDSQGVLPMTTLQRNETCLMDPWAYS